MGLTKKYLKSKPVCKVTFKVSPEQIEGAKKVALVGGFNNWDVKETPMRKLKDGSFTKTLELSVGEEYEFRYLIDGEKWINDEAADKYVPTGVSYEQNCAVSV